MNRWPPRPSLAPSFYKGHGLGNDYLVFEEGDGWVATPANVRAVCDRHRGVGSDGIVVLLRGRMGVGGPPSHEPGDDAAGPAVHLRMFNPDGGEFERSGNGLRVLASYLARRSRAQGSFAARVGGDDVRITLHGRTGPVHDVSVEMGRARTGPAAVSLDPSALDDGASLKGPDGRLLDVVPVSVGNPHLVIVTDGSTVGFSEECLAELGPFVTAHPALRHGANVQLAQPVGVGRCRALIWERGVGRTSASGTSACAVAVALVSSGRSAPGEVTVEMPGGELTVEVTAELDVVLRGAVEEVCDGRLSAELVKSIRAPHPTGAGLLASDPRDEEEPSRGEHPVRQPGRHER
jgi:diaminopimelate epimerase